MANENDLNGIRANLKTWLKAFNENDIETLFSLYDPESLYANPDSPLMKGIDEIKPWYEEAVPQLEGTLLHKEEAAFVEGGMGFIVGSYFLRLPEGVVPTDENTLIGRTCLIYRRDKDGLWKLLFDMDHVPPDVFPSDFV